MVVWVDWASVGSFQLWSLMWLQWDGGCSWSSAGLDGQDDPSLAASQWWLWAGSSSGAMDWACICGLSVFWASHRMAVDSKNDYSKSKCFKKPRQEHQGFLCHNLRSPRTQLPDHSTGLTIHQGRLRFNRREIRHYLSKRRGSKSLQSSLLCHSLSIGRIIIYSPPSGKCTHPLQRPNSLVPLRYQLRLENQDFST